MPAPKTTNMVLSMTDARLTGEGNPELSEETLQVLAYLMQKIGEESKANLVCLTVSTW